MLTPGTLYDKLWHAHLVSQRPAHPAVLYVDLQLIHDGTYRRAFELLEAQGLRVVRPERNVAVADHCLPSSGPIDRLPAVVTGLLAACRRHGIRVLGPDHEDQGIVHVIGPELGLTQPGMTLICADSHTTTHGAFGALALVVGTTQVLHALATQCVLQRRARNMSIRLDGTMRPGVTAKDLVLALIRREGIALGAGYAIEYSGAAVERMSMEQRMTLCNMSAELGARTALVAPDETTFAYLRGRKFSPLRFEEAIERWKALRSDPDAPFDACVSFDAATVEPMVTYGTTPAMGMAVTGRVPEPANAQESHALRYMGLAPGRAAQDLPVDMVFIGSCTNSRIEDLRGAAQVLRGRKIAGKIRLLVVPGSQAVRRQAEAEGLHEVFRAAGGEWGIPGCSLCVGMNGELAAPGQYVASTSNRNFQGRQGPGARTLLVSPLTAAASAVAGRIADPRPYLA